MMTPKNDDIPFGKLIEEIINHVLDGKEEAVREDIDKILQLVIDRVDNAILESDPSPKMILHEPYRTVRNNVLEVFYGK